MKNPHLLGGGFSWRFLTIKLFFEILTQTCPPTEVTAIHLYIYIYAYNLIRWATLELQKLKKQRERWKTKAKKGKDEKEDKTLKREKPPHQV